MRACKATLLPGDAQLLRQQPHHQHVEPTHPGRAVAHPRAQFQEVGRPAQPGAQQGGRGGNQDQRHHRPQAEPPVRPHR